LLGFFYLEPNSLTILSLVSSILFPITLFLQYFFNPNIVLLWIWMFISFLFNQVAMWPIAILNKFFFFNFLLLFKQFVQVTPPSGWGLECNRWKLMSGKFVYLDTVFERSYLSDRHCLSDRYCLCSLSLLNKTLSW